MDQFLFPKPITMNQFLFPKPTRDFIISVGSIMLFYLLFYLLLVLLYPEDFRNDQIMEERALQISVYIGMIVVLILFLSGVITMIAKGNQGETTTKKKNLVLLAVPFIIQFVITLGGFIAFRDNMLKGIVAGIGVYVSVAILFIVFGLIVVDAE